jgi:hypothetical protein
MIVIIPFIAFFKLLFKEIYKDLSVHLWKSLFHF